jgi:hypothetical protein
MSDSLTPQAIYGLKAPQIAQQGHRYHLNGKNVLALESGLRVRVLYFDHEQPWFSKIAKVFCNELIPQPMKYFHGEIPK